MGILYRYEMKKLLSQKVLWIAFFIMTALIVAQGLTGLIVGNADLLKKADEISGRKVDQELISEIQKENKLDDYPMMKNLWTQCLQNNDLTGVDEQTLYESRQAVNESQMNAYQMSDEEKAYWSEKDAKVQKPFVSQIYICISWISLLALFLWNLRTDISDHFEDYGAKGNILR